MAALNIFDKIFHSEGFISLFKSLPSEAYGPILIGTLIILLFYFVPTFISLIVNLRFKLLIFILEVVGLVGAIFTFKLLALFWLLSLLVLITTKKKRYTKTIKGETTNKSSKSKSSNINIVYK